MIVRPAESLLIGEYELDEFSYSLVDQTKAYPDAPILHIIRATSKLLANIEFKMICFVIMKGFVNCR
jgi:hypothetical protein